MTISIRVMVLMCVDVLCLFSLLLLGPYLNHPVALGG